MISKRILKLETNLFESLSNARKLYSSKISPGVFEELVSIDPSKTFKYIEKICKFYIELPRINIVKLKQEIENFDKLSSKNLIEIKDINRFKTYYQFSSYLDKNSDKMSKSEEKALIKNDGSEVVLNTESFLVLLIKNEKASIQYGSGTKWCIAARDDNYFKNYRKREVTFYFIFQKNLTPKNSLYKIAVAVYKDGKKDVFNALDSKIDFSVVENLGLSENLFNPIELDSSEILDTCIRGTWKINSRGEIDVSGDVNISHQNLNSILQLGQFGEVSGNFDCSNNNLRTLEGAPKRTGGEFSARENKLISLIDAPEWVFLNFNVSSNEIDSFEFSPKYVGGNFRISNNKLISFKFCPRTFEGGLMCSGNKFMSLQNFPREINGDFSCDSLPKILGDKRDIEYKLKSICHITGRIEI